MIAIILFLLFGGRLQKHKRERRSAQLGGLVKAFEKEIGRDIFHKDYTKPSEIKKQRRIKKEEKIQQLTPVIKEEKQIEKPQKTEEELIEEVVDKTEKKNKGRKTVEELIEEAKKIAEEETRPGEAELEKKDQTDDEYYESLFKG